MKYFHTIGKLKVKALYTYSTSLSFKVYYYITCWNKNGTQLCFGLEKRES